MTYSAERVMSVVGATCRRCGGETVFKADAIGRMIERCPQCDRVGPVPDRPMHRSLTPPAAVAVIVPRDRLRPLSPGEAYCQRCAQPMPEGPRYCVPCQRIRMATVNHRPKQPKATMRPCRGCGSPTPRTTGRPRNDCEACRG